MKYNVYLNGEPYAILNFDQADLLLGEEHFVTNCVQFVDYSKKEGVKLANETIGFKGETFSDKDANYILFSFKNGFNFEAVRTA